MAKDNIGASTALIVKADTPAFIKLLNELQHEATDVISRIKILSERLTELQTSKGVSLLEVKFHSLLSYLSHLTLYMLLKVNGVKIEGNTSVDSLIELRTVLEKIKPMELKLKYQIDKLVKAAITADEATPNKQHHIASESDNKDIVDSLMYRPNPSALVDDNESPDIEQDQQPKDAKYKPPRVAPMPYNEVPTTPFTKAYKLSERAKEKAAKSRIIRDLRSQFDDRPEELSTEGTGYSRKENMTDWDMQWNQRETFEEDHFVRLNMTKKDKWHRKQLQKSGGMGRFQDEFENLDMDFESLSSVKRAVDASEEKRFGSGLLGRKNKRLASSLSVDADGGEGANRKKKYRDVNDLVASTANEYANRKGRFEKRVGRFARGGKKGGK